MELKKTDNVYYYPHQPETDQPMLAYLNGARIALADDAGNSAAHVDEFYQSLEAEGLRKLSASQRPLSSCSVNPTM